MHYCFFRGIWAFAKGDVKQAYACQIVSVQAFVKGFQAQKDENWYVFSHVKFLIVVSFNFLLQVVLLLNRRIDF